MGIHASIIALPIIILMQYILQLGLSFILSAITVYVRDVEYLINVIMMLAFYLSPIVYSADMIPTKYLPLFKLNPMFHIIKYYRDILYYGKFPEMGSDFILLFACIIILIVGYLIFRKLEKRFAEEL